MYRGSRSGSGARAFCFFFWRMGSIVLWNTFSSKKTHVSAVSFSSPISTTLLFIYCFCFINPGDAARAFRSTRAWLAKKLTARTCEARARAQFNHTTTPWTTTSFFCCSDEGTLDQTRNSLIVFLSECLITFSFSERFSVLGFCMEYLRFCITVIRSSHPFTKLLSPF